MKNQKEVKHKMAINKNERFDAVSSILVGIGMWLLAMILQATGIFSMFDVAGNQIAIIGLFVGLLYGGLHDSIPILK